MSERKKGNERLVCDGKNCFNPLSCFYLHLSYYEMQPKHHEIAFFAVWPLTRQVFVACQKSIPTTAILPELELEDSIDTLKELTEQCRVDAEKAQASVAEDAIAIKKKIMDESWNQ